MLLLFLVIANVVNADCQPCLYESKTYSCGARISMNGLLQACYNGGWRPCRWDPIKTTWVCASGINNSNILDTNYHFTTDGHLYTEFVTVAKFHNRTKTYVVDRIMHSSELKLGYQVIWPGFDIGFDESDKNVMMQVEHWNVTAVHSKCCASISVGTSCYIKFCCGTGCCC